MRKKEDKRRTNLPVPTEEDAQRTPDRVKRLPNGALAWKCHHCGLPASSMSKDGTKYLCYKHGGDRKIQRDPVERARLRAQGIEPPRPNGRPLRHGFYAKDGGTDPDGVVRNVHDIVAEYEAAGLDPDDTDPDMLHLRARIERLLAVEPSMRQLATAVQEVLDAINEWRDSTVTGDVRHGTDVDGVLEELHRLRDLRQVIRSAHSLVSVAVAFGDAIEERHGRLVLLAHKRADTRLKNKAAEELGVFTMMVRRLMVIMSEQLPPDVLAAFQKRLERDLAEVPTRALEMPAAVEPSTVEVEPRPALREARAARRSAKSNQH